MSQKSAQSVKPLLGPFKGIWLAIAVISGAVNVLALTGSFYMLQVYDRVLASHSVSTLVALSILALGLYMFQGVLEIMRSQILVRLAARVDRLYMQPAHAAALRLSILGRQTGEAQQPIRDVDTVRGFLSSQGPVAILDLPWMPLFIGFVFLLHPVLGWVTVGGALVLIALTLWTERSTGEPAKELAKSLSTRASYLESHARNAEVLKAMGFADRALARFNKANSEHLKLQRSLVDITSGFSAVSRTIRLVLQSALLGLGAYLVIHGDLSAGAIIACSVASSRAYAPIEIAIANWKGFVQARQSAERITQMMRAENAQIGERIELPAPTGKVTLEGLTVAVPGTQRPVISNVTMELEAGQALAVIGQSAAGKSTLARALVGIWPALRGTVRLDGAEIAHWPENRLGRHIGYLPQDVELFDGTITENISRFEEDADSLAVIAAAKAAGVHELILRLPEGYETRLGERGMALSAGQRQRVALARALYRDPFLVVLDEPNSNLDAEGEEALAQAIRSVRERGGIVVVVAHRSGVLAAVDKVAVMGNGQLTAFGDRDEILKKATRIAAPVPVDPKRVQRPA
ncbi:MAG: type I secretion system permease/ATPase [Hyphomicrobium sp.]|nr:type I secretion system permease/ATPase [Hyphomicrobium sp.]